MFVEREVDHGFLLDRGPTNRNHGVGAHGALLQLNEGKPDEKEEPLNSLTGMTCFALSEFGFPKTTVSSGNYNRQAKSCIIRQRHTDKDALWGNGLRAPIGARVGRAGSALNWGALTAGVVADESILNDDCTPHTLDTYGQCLADPKKNEPHRKTPWR